MAVDKADKNHSFSGNPFNTPGEGALYDVSGHLLCPVVTFKKYTSLLHPIENALRQGQSSMPLKMILCGIATHHLVT